MTSKRLLNAGVLAACASVFLVSGCSQDSPTPPASTPSEQAATPDASQEPAPDSADQDPGELDGDYAFGTDRDQIAQAIETAFSSQSGKARWDGDILILAVDGSASDTMAGFTECRVLATLLTEEDSSTIEFPDGSVECQEVLSVLD